MHYKRSLALLCAIAAATLTLTGCEEDDKQVAADVLDSANSAVSHLIGKAPSGEEIVDAVEGGIDSVSEVIGSVSGTIDRNSANHQGFVENTLGVED